MYYSKLLVLFLLNLHYTRIYNLNFTIKDAFYRGSECSPKKCPWETKRFLFYLMRIKLCDALHDLVPKRRSN